jgi:hypothetical protein
MEEALGLCHSVDVTEVVSPVVGRHWVAYCRDCREDLTRHAPRRQEMAERIAQVHRTRTMITATH